VVVVGVVLAVIAALVHVYIFVLESMRWTTPGARRVFGTTPEEAQATRELAFNQGFYNLFLAVLVVVGTILLAAGSAAAGFALLFAGTGSMLAASVVLIVSSPSKASAAIKQGLVPLLAVASLLLGSLIG